MKALAQCGTSIDLGTWVQEGDSADGNWTVTNGGNTVKQTINGDPTIYVSPDSFINVIITGDISVETNDDNDFVGFVFGYNSPDSNTANNNYDFFLFDWKQGQQTANGNFGAEGYFLSKVDGIVTDVQEAFWGHGGASVDVIGSVTGNNTGWVDFQTYSFALTYTNTRVVISINNDTLFDEYGCYEPGRFGFYNYSQPDVEYSNFAYRVAAAFDVVTPTVCLGDSASVRAVSDSCANPNAQVNNTIVSWDWDLGDGSTSTDTNVIHLYDSAGVYPVRLIVTDYLGCKDTAFNAVTVLSASTELGSDTSVCPGTSVTFDAGTNGTAYLWNTGETTQTIDVDSAADYSVVISIPFGCSDTDTVALSLFPVPTKPFGIDTAICSNDSLILDAQNAGSTYLWQDASTNQTLVAKTSGTYNVTITSVNGCVTIDTLLLTVNNLPALELGNDTAFCGPDSIVLDASNAGASFLWQDGNTNQTRSALSSALYKVTVTDGNTCSSTDSIDVTVFPVIVPGLTTSDDTLCFGDTAVLTASGGVTYNWQNDPGLSANDTNIVQAFPTTSTSYLVTVTDLNGCSDTTSKTITVNALPVLNISASADTLCQGTTSLLTITGASFYVWDNVGALNFTSNDSAFTTPDTSTLFSVIATDSNGCVDTARIAIHVDTLPEISITPPVSAICLNDSVSLQASGAESYSWAPNYNINNTIIDSIVVHPTVDTTYFVTGTDANGCQSDTSVFIQVNPLPIVLISASSDTICFGDTTQLTASGGVTYNWQNDPGLSAYDTNIVQAFPTTSTSYLVTVTDSNGCSDTISKTITVNALPVLNLSASADTLCQGDTSLLTITGAASYVWDNAGILDFTSNDSAFTAPDTSSLFTVIATDSNGCVDTARIAIHVDTLPEISINPSINAICLNDSISLKASGAESYSWAPNYNINGTIIDSIVVHPTVDTTYFVTGTDANGCQSDTNVFIQVNALPIVLLSASNPEFCIGDSTGILATGAESYAWTFDASLSDTIGDSVVAIPSNTIDYLVTGTDSNGCIDTATISITVNQLPIITASPANDTVCFGDSTNILLSGASVYNWSSASSLNIALDDSVFAKPQTPTTYVVTGTDLNGCVDSIQVMVGVDTLPVVSVSPTSASVCLGLSTPLVASGAQNYAWSPGAGLNSNSSAAVVSSPTVNTLYTVTGTDANGCSDTTTVSVLVDTLPIISISPIDTTICLNDTVALTAEGANTYTWQSIPALGTPAGTTVNFSPTVPTIIFAIGTDGNGCTGVGNTNVFIDTLPEVSIQLSSAVICLGDTMPLTAINANIYQWEASSALSTLVGASTLAFPTSATSFTVTGTDLNDCSFTFDTTIFVDTLPVISVTPAADSICVGQNTQLTANGAVNYAWSPATGLGLTTGTSVVSSATDTITYTVTGTDGNGCESDTTVTVNVTPLPVITLSLTDDTVCTLTADTLVAQGAFTYQWSTNGSVIEPIEDSIVVFPAQTQVYSVVGTGPGGCQSTESIAVNVHAIPSISAGNDVAKCGYDSLELVASAGFVSYSWSPGTGLSDSTIANPMCTAQSTTTYTAFIEDQFGCVFTDDVIVTVNPQPSINPGSDRAICETTTTRLGGSPTGPNGAIFSWTSSSQRTTLSDSSAANPEATPDSTTIYKVIVTTNRGCVDSASVEISVNFIPVLEIITSPPHICRGDTDTLYVTPGNARYQWTGTEGIVDTLPGLLVAAPKEDAEYTLTATDTNGCVNTLSWMVEVKDLPTVRAGIDVEMCKFDSVQFQAEDDTLLTYLWSNPENLEDPTLANAIAFPDQTTTFFLTGTDSNECRSVSASEVRVYELPYVDAGDDILNCDMGSVMLGSNPSGPEGAIYSWSPSFGLDDSTAANPFASITERLTYTLTVSTEFGCTDSDTIRVTSDCWSVYAPSAFSPDGNNINDEYLIKYYRIQNPKLVIWDRFGHVVFQTLNLDRGWNGSVDGQGEAPFGVYYWLLTFEDENGRALSDNGTVTLVR